MTSLPTNWDELPLTLKASEVATVLRCHRNDIYELCARSVLPHRRLGRAIRISRDQLRQFIEAPAAANAISPAPASDVSHRASVPTPTTLKSHPARPRLHLKPARGKVQAAGLHATGG